MVSCYCLVYGIVTNLYDEYIDISFVFIFVLYIYDVNHYALIKSVIGYMHA